MKTVREPVPQLAGFEPYDPKYLPADVMISANENPCDVPADVRAKVAEAIAAVPFNRYPDPLANDLRAMIAQANGLTPDQVLLGNGGDELLFNLVLAWGGEGRKMLNIPPTFSTYALNAEFTKTEVVNIPRNEDMTIDEDAVIARVAQGDIDFVIITSPNNPTGAIASNDFVERVLNASDALVLVDEAYGEFSQHTALPLLAEHENLLILHTFSKAYSLAGVRLGYVLGSPRVIGEFIKFRQPYSVDAVSQAIGRVVYENRAAFVPGIAQIIQERERVSAALVQIPGVQRVFPSDANFILVKMPDAGEVWQRLYDQSVLVRDFSRTPGIENCLRITVGSPAENDKMLAALDVALNGSR